MAIRGGEPANKEAGQLVLGRKVGQGVFIGRGVKVTVASINVGAGMVRLVIEAPQHMAVSRDDVTYESHLLWQTKREDHGKPPATEGAA